MIRTIIIMAESGVVLFIKKYENSVKNARMVGQLLVAMLKFSSVTTGMLVNYIELTNLGVTIVRNHTMNICCALFMDQGDGAEFGKLLATEILRGFHEDYAHVLNSFAQHVQDFSEFELKLIHIIQNSAQSVLNRLVRSSHGIEKAVLVTESSHIFHTSDIDELKLLANLQTLAGLSNDIMGHSGDSVRSVTLECNSRSNSKVQIRRIEQSTLIFTAQRHIISDRYEGNVKIAIEMLLRLEEVVNNLHSRER